MTERPPITKSFAKLQAWLLSHAPDVAFRAPANPASITNFNNKSGRSLPEDLHKMLLIANGETRLSAGAIGNWRLMPITEIQAAWGLLTKLTEKDAFINAKPVPSPYLQTVWWHPGWIPFVSSDVGDYICIDTAPPEVNRTGQVILFLQNRPHRVLIAENLRAWLDRIVRDLQTGLYTYDPENGFDGEAFMWSSLEGKHLFDTNQGKRITGE